jgi:hypothetical protein
MARYAGSGKNTVEGCRSIDVLEWHRRGSPASQGCVYADGDGDQFASRSPDEAAMMER